jgi:hypothetical protein
VNPPTHFSLSLFPQTQMRLVLAATALLVMLLALAASLVQAQGSGTQCNFGSDTLNLLAFSVGPSSMQAAVASFSNATGVPVRVDLVGPSIEALQVNADSDLRTGANIYDVYMVRSPPNLL